MGIEDKVVSELDSSIDLYTNKQGKIAVTNANYQEVNTFVNTCFSIFSIIICGYSIYKGSMSIGEMMLVNNIQSRTTMPLFFFNNYYLLYKSSFPSVTRLVGMTEIETEPITNKKTESEIDFESVILSGISYSYDGDQNVLSNVSLEIDKGDNNMYITLEKGTIIE